MIIAIHKTKNGFDERWIKYCEKNHIQYKIVNCYRSDIIEQLADCDALMWHYHHGLAADAKFAKGLLFSIEQAGKKVFPNFQTAWHFDDKVGQKYLLEAVGAPLVQSDVFYSEKEALKWIENTTFPKVFKLRGGAGSYNVKLIREKRIARKYVKKAFRKGFSQYNPLSNLKERWYHYRKGHSSITYVLKGLARFFHKPPFARLVGNEKGYVYFQEFIPNNTFDIRIVVVGDKAFALKRFTREGDFRASGSGNIVYDKAQIDERCVKIAFDVSKKLTTQCLAYDFVFNKENDPQIIEISYGFAADAYDACKGYWDSELNWYSGSFNPYGWMIEELRNE